MWRGSCCTTVPKSPTGEMVIPPCTDGHLRARGVLLVDGLEVGAGDVGVDLGGADVGVAQKEMDRLELSRRTRLLVDP